MTVLVCVELLFLRVNEVNENMNMFSAAYFYCYRHLAAYIQVSSAQLHLLTWNLGYIVAYTMYQVLRVFVLLHTTMTCCQTVTCKHRHLSSEASSHLGVSVTG